MRKKLYSISIILLILLFLLALFKYSNITHDAIVLGYDIFIYNIFPSLFPMFIMANILVNIGFAEVLGEIFSNLMNKLFHVNGYSSFVFFMSILSGFPSSAKYIDDLMGKGLLSLKEANKVLKFSHFSNPLFLVNTVGLCFFKDKKFGFLILFIQFLSNVILGIILRGKSNSDRKKSSHGAFNNLISHINNDSFFKLFFKSISNAVMSLLNIFGVVIFFLVIVFILMKGLNISNPIAKVLLSGSLEVTTGLRLLASMEVSNLVKLIIAIVLLNFGGFCIHAQIMSILKERKIRYLPFLLARLLHAGIGIVLTLISYLFLFKNWF